MLRLKKWAGCRPAASSAALLLAGSVLTGLIWLAAAPKQAFSENENRVLEPAPVPSVDSILSGSFMKSAENYVVDHFPLRDPFVSLNTAEQILLGKRDLAADYSTVPAEGGVYFGKDDHIYEVLLPDKTGIFRNNASALADFAEKSGVSLTILPVPSGSQEQPENLPYSAPNHDQRQEYKELEQAVGRKAVVVDLFDKLSLKTGGDYYFKTDHHWNAYGAYIGYAALSEAMGFPCVKQSAFAYRAVAQPFYGMLYSKAVNTWQKPDALVLPFVKGNSSVVQVTAGKIHRGIYWEEYLDKKDKYSVYLGGNPSLTVVKNPDAQGGKLLLLKDSYANSMIPYLSQNFSEIHLVDLRYYNKDIYEYITQNGIKQVAAVYSMKQLCDVSIANKLRR
ncbi:DHHW family protein [Caproiciproducens sp. NJN-50]|uniref:DHHW family protein n=1 Tax=Caproiciproducens sp. NJN-50 TaxID=2507162 RepID=UPI0013E8C52C|nr:DHHW family protein [Caproiciproducens sp. NJN-50]